MALYESNTLSSSDLPLCLRSATYRANPPLVTPSLSESLNNALITGNFCSLDAPSMSSLNAVSKSSTYPRISLGSPLIPYNPKRLSKIILGMVRSGAPGK